MVKESGQMVEVKPESAVALLKKTYPVVPDAAVILGSGVNVLEGLHNPLVLKYTDLFGHAPSVAGHSGTLTIGRLGTAGHDPLVAVCAVAFTCMKVIPGTTSLSPPAPWWNGACLAFW